MKKKPSSKTGFDPRDIGLDSDSFMDSNDAKSKRQSIVMNVQARGKVGKDHFALADVPGPIILYNHDNGLRGVVEQFRDAGAHIIVAGDPNLSKGQQYPHYQVVDPETLVENMGKKNSSVLDQIKDKAYPTWQRFVTDYYQGLESEARTLIIDTGSAAFQLGKLAFHGMSRGVTSKDDPWGQKGGELKAIFKGLVSHGLNYDKNVIWLHRVKPEWVGGEATGNDAIDGYDQVPYEVEVSLSLTKTVKKGETLRRGVINESRFYGDVMNGQKFGGPDEPELSFKSVAAYVTMTDPEDWT